jgi:hypothetical protein
MSLQLRHESREFLKIITTPKPQAPLPPPQYLLYEKCMPMLTKHVTVCFQRSYINDIILRATNANGKIIYLSPSDQAYSEFIQSTVLQVYESLPQYLQKSIFYYYNVIDKTDEKDEGIATLTLTISRQIKALLDQHIIKIAETVETQGPTSGPVLDAIDRLANTVSGKKFVPSTPDNSPVTVIQ